MIRENNNVQRIDLLGLFSECIRRWWLIALCTLLAGTAMYAYTYFLVTPLYQSTVKMYVNNNSDVNISSLSISTGDLSASIQLVDLYAVILDTKDTLDVVIDEADLDMDYTQLQGMLSTKAVNDTQVFAVTVTDADPARAELIASTIGNVLPGVIEDIVNSTEAKIVEHAIVPSARSSPSYTNNTMRGCLLGFVFAVAIITVMFLTDTTIKNDSDVLRICDTAILAYIPNLDGEKTRHGYYSSSKYYKKYYKSYGSAYQKEEKSE
ncbi:MAG: Wzz/FepE/Etk N-terminal domain-containing protein [Oscillospiraceae bacterium]|nr:Wzz/FepE/Etk N-terminal domain-containing protein [Oscillospiraceae bacterium]